MKTIWITGAGGLIGNHVVRSAARFAPEERVIGLTRKGLDLTDFARVRAEFQREKPELIIHCAALSQSPHCQADPARARKLNVEVTGRLVSMAEKARFVFISSDLVFDGGRGNYDESAPLNPLSVYAQTKVEAERIVAANPNHIIIRTSLNAGISPTGDRGFNEQMRLGWERGQTLRLFTDEFRCPIAAEVTAKAIWELGLRGQPGIYHVAGSERLSRWEIGQALAARWRQFNPKIEATSLKGYEGAPRAPDTSLNCAKAQRLLSFPLPAFTHWLDARPNDPL